MNHYLFTVGLTVFVTVFAAISNAQESSTYTDLVRTNGATFHKNFSAGDFHKNGPLVTEDIYVNSNNAILVGRDNFVNRIKRYNGPFPGMQLNDRIVIVEDNIAAVHYILQGNHNGKYGTYEATGNKVEAMSAEFFVMDEQGIMKDLLTITQLDKLLAQIEGEEKIGEHQNVSLYPIDHTISKEIGKKTVDLYHRHYNSRNWGALADLAIEEVTVNWNGEILKGKAELLRKLKERLTPFPDLYFQLDRSVVEGNRAAIAYTMNGHHEGPYSYKDQRIEATGKAVQVREAQHIEVNKEGKVKSVIVISNGDEFYNTLVN